MTVPTLSTERLEEIRNVRNETPPIFSPPVTEREDIAMASELLSLRALLDMAEGALEPFGRILVYSIEEDPSLYVTYGGETLAHLDPSSTKGIAALKLEQHLARARTALTAIHTDKGTADVAI